MLDSHAASRSHANSALILGHTVSGMGEKSATQKYARALSSAGYHTHPVVDILELLGSDYEPLAKLNYDLADSESEIMEDLKDSPALPSSDLLIIASWCFSVAALLATGVHKTRPTAIKLYAHHPNERILPKLYDPATVVITESLLANERARTYGIDPGKTLYLPHTYPQACETILPNRTYVEQLAARQGKSLRPQTRVIGCVGRLEYGKNCEWAVEAVRLLAAQGEDVVLVLKGDFPEQSPYPEFKPRFSEMLTVYQDEPWLLWDRCHTPYPQVIEEYASFDVLLHPSGAEGASNVVVECLGLGKPAVVLNCSTNPYLFKGIAHFVQVDPQIRNALVPFFVPDMTDLLKVLSSTLKPPSREEVAARFSEQTLQARMPLLFKPDPHAIQELYHDDCRRHSLLAT